MFHLSLLSSHNSLHQKVRQSVFSYWPKVDTSSILKATIAFTLTTYCITANAANVFINEFHYDNAGSDINEGVEIAALAGTVLDDWQLLFYNGSNGNIYKSETLAGTVLEQQSGYGTLAFNISGLQNGPADAIALVNNHNILIEFLSYEGSVIATEGAAFGNTSIDVGIEENINTLAEFSIQRIGNSLSNGDISWLLQSASLGTINNGQYFSPSTVPIPAGFLLYLSAITSFTIVNRVLRKKVRSTHCSNQIYCSSDIHSTSNR